MTRAQIELLVSRLVAGNAKLLDPGEALDPDRDLLELGIDSYALVVLVTDLETEFDIAIPDEMLTPAVFRCAASVTDAVAGLLSGATA